MRKTLGRVKAAFDVAVANAWAWAVSHPARSRGILLATLAVLAGVIPGLPINAIDAVFAAALIMGGAEGVKAVTSKSKTPTEN